jgi:transcriptional regulator with XRE-family HTH domain
MTAIGDAIKRLREERGWNQRDLAERMTAAGFKLDYSNLAKRERGEIKRILPPERRVYAQVFGMKLEEFEATWRASKIEQTNGGGAGIPVINRAPAGTIVDYEEYGIDSGQGHEYIERGGIDDPLAFAVIVVGASMEPALFEGDYVIFSPVARVPKPRAELKPGAVCFVRTSPEVKGCGCCIARFKGTDGKALDFTKDNKKHKGFSVSREHIEQLAVAVERRTKRL